MEHCRTLPGKEVGRLQDLENGEMERFRSSPPQQTRELREGKEAEAEIVD